MNGRKSMHARDIVLVAIALCGEKEEFGRTSLQKVTYLASVELGVDLGHRAYYYGPYSAAVEADTEALAVSGLINESVEHLDFVSAAGFPGTRYRFSLTERGEQRVAQLREAYSEQFAKLEERVNSILRVVGSADQYTLSTAAKTLYIALQHGGPISTEEIRSLAKERGWDLKTRGIERVTKMLSELDYVSVEEQARK